MEKLLFAALLLVDGVCVGLAVIVGVFDYRLARAGNDTDSHMWQAVTKVGLAVAVGVVVIRQASLGAATASWAAWGYLIGTAIVVVGLAGQTQALITKVAKTEFPKEGDG